MVESGLHFTHTMVRFRCLDLVPTVQIFFISSQGNFGFVELEIHKVRDPGD